MFLCELTNPLEVRCTKTTIKEQVHCMHYMHLVLLGVFKRLLTIWTGDWSKKHFKHKLGTWERAKLERRIHRIRLSYPEEFHRIPTTFKCTGKLKANELRTLLLYTGPVIFKGVLSKEKYEHFIYLHLAIRILCSSTLCIKYSQLARECLQHFAYRFGAIYGNNHLIYNVHSLIHLVDDCEIHGPLDSVSAFPFETYLGSMKMLVRSLNKVLAQIVRRISELKKVSEYNQVLKPSIFNQHSKSNDLFTSLKPNTRSNSFYLCKNGAVVKVVAFSASEVKMFVAPRNFYSTPMKSTFLDIFRSSGMEGNIKGMPIEDVLLVAKCWVIPAGMTCCIVPLLHHNY